MCNTLFELQIISSLNFELSCAAENSRVDLRMEEERNKALNERIAYLGLYYMQTRLIINKQCYKIHMYLYQTY